LYGRIVSADLQSFTVQRYEPAPNTVPFLSLECRIIDDVWFTEQRKVISRIAVGSLLFVVAKAPSRMKMAAVRGFCSKVMEQVTTDEL
jgi:endogenous inhibitor of DNA gyrase (YacG/DUF329 family)